MDSVAKRLCVHSQKWRSDELNAPAKRYHDEFIPLEDREKIKIRFYSPFIFNKRCRERFVLN